MAENIISPDTNLDLHQAAERFANTVKISCYTPVGKFVTAYAGVEVVDINTLVTGDRELLTVSAEGNGIRRLFVVIDLFLEGPASIVKPGYYDEQGNWDAMEGSFSRPVQRPLTEYEGRALVSDINEIIAATPADRRM